mmetsp:Transcript_37274/g.42807  ORF Transcript_37274/g.42807 Transcript_37274/m.42807 type:complete len:142 (+) Transcript_37274:418-843(+)
MISDLLSGNYDEEKMRQEFRAALSNWRGETSEPQFQKLDKIDEYDEYPNEDEGCGVGTCVADAQIGTDSKLKPKMVTTTVQHRGGNVHEVLSYGPIGSDRIMAKELNLPEKVSCWNCYKLGVEGEFYFDELVTQSFFCQMR